MVPSSFVVVGCRWKWAIRGSGSGAMSPSLRAISARRSSGWGGGSWLGCQVLPAISAVSILELVANSGSSRMSRAPNLHSLRYGDEVVYKELFPIVMAVHLWGVRVGQTACVISLTQCCSGTHSQF